MIDSMPALGSTATSEALSKTLTAERQMYATYLDYFFFIDQKLPCEKAVECFTEDTEITYHMKGSPLSFKSRSDYLSFLKVATGAQQMTAHVVGQNLFRWSGGKPRLLTYVTVWQWFLDKAHLGENRPADFVTIGYSEDDFACVNGKWLIARRLVKPVAGLVATGALPGFGGSSSGT